MVCLRFSNNPLPAVIIFITPLARLFWVLLSASKHPRHHRLWHDAKLYDTPRNVSPSYETFISPPGYFCYSSFPSTIHIVLFRTPACLQEPIRFTRQSSRASLYSRGTNCIGASGGTISLYRIPSIAFRWTGLGKGEFAAKRLERCDVRVLPAQIAPVKPLRHKFTFAICVSIATLSHTHTPKLLQTCSNFSICRAKE